MSASAAIRVNNNFTLADRIKIQQQTCRDKKYINVGHLTSIVFEAQRNISGLSQSRPRFMNSQQAKASNRGLLPDSMHPFSEKQMVLWSSITLDWLSPKNAPIVAISKDQRDLLLPQGLTPLPAIPDPRWMPEHAFAACYNSKNGCKGCIPPRIAQQLVGCPVVGDRVRDKITARDGRAYGVIHPIADMCVILGGEQGGFAHIRGGVDPSDGTHLALLIDDSNPEQLNAYFVGGRFQFGG
jgi:hypothetical protein